MEKILEQAIAIARRDYKGEGEFEHCSRVMEQVESTEQKIIAILHHLLEKEYRTYSYVADTFPLAIADSLLVVSRLNHSNLKENVLAICREGNQDAIAVKIADLQDELAHVDESNRYFTPYTRNNYHIYLEELRKASAKKKLKETII
ncbi:hypothetical protein Xen7305DRAFT_00009120 [Xenococcus sp. PCC 7305]|uniref:hypothetical protein n=1 Tax=Xenococcus sp. PCC 7305 TaxID=102125 RepID=UPI0002AC5CCE|nr:hypothetical protein [Xenococcus sp. PCC 7305]ELS01210.1 hypothetical protein Xen7305DRAFT_00009120 [Xenococcus sp. PCC 7305]